MRILALDTSDQVLSAALDTENGVFCVEIDAGIRHSELLMECIDGLFKTAGLNPRELDLVVCMKGPGSFTGLRIGFSTAKGLCTALGIRFATVPTLDCLAYNLSIWPGIVVPAIDAKKGCFFSSLYRGGIRLTDYMDAPPEIIAKEAARLRLFPGEPLVLTGSGAGILLPQLRNYLSENCSIDRKSGRGKAMELLNIVKCGIINTEDELGSGPMYIRKSDAELNYS
jgi:tRNA threonylcarbamoyladenosine biosynthesis protein TsaB